MGGLFWISTDHGEPACGAINAVAALKAVARGRFCFLQELPNGVLAGGWEPRMVHQWISNLTCASTAVNTVFP